MMDAALRISPGTPPAINHSNRQFLVVEDGCTVPFLGYPPNSLTAQYFRVFDQKTATKIKV